MWSVDFKITLADASEMLWSEFLEWWAFAWPVIEQRAKQNEELAEQAKQIKKQSKAYEAQNVKEFTIEEA